MERLNWVWSVVIGACSVVTTQAAIAQPEASPAGSAPASAEQAAPATATANVVNTNPNVAQTVPVAAPGTCRLGVNAGFEPGDAQTAASLICRDLPPETRTSNLSYRIDLEKLGTAMFVTLSSEQQGQVVDSRRLKVNSLEDLATVGPRLGTALVEKKPLPETERVGNLTSADAVAPVHKSGQFQVEAGVLAAAAPGLATVSPGIQLALRYDTPRWMLTTQVRLAWDTNGEDRFSMSQLGVGPRYMFSTSDTTLFVGGGMVVEGLGKSVLKTAENGGDWRDSDKGSGIGAYAEVGLEMMRLHKNRLNVALRADFPTFTVGGDYLMPLSLSTSFVFD